MFVRLSRRYCCCSWTRAGWVRDGLEIEAQVRRRFGVGVVIGLLKGLLVLMRRLPEYVIGLVVLRKRSSMLGYGRSGEVGLLLVLGEQVVPEREVA